MGRAEISDLEIGFSARNGAEWDRLLDALEVFGLVETTAAHVRRAKQIQRLLASRHQRGRKLPDLLVAAAAETMALTVLHYDADFDLITETTGQLSEWVVPAGSIDEPDTGSLRVGASGRAFPSGPGTGRRLCWAIRAAGGSFRQVRVDMSSGLVYKHPIALLPDGG
ncbi:MAG: PIN domain-containing protein [Solirubrobacteraceae bacterium]